MEVRIANEAMPTTMPSIIKSVRKRYRRMLPQSLSGDLCSISLRASCILQRRVAGLSLSLDAVEDDGAVTQGKLAQRVRSHPIIVRHQ